MALVEWSQSLKVEIKQFDDQHQQLVAMVNQLHRAIKEGQGAEALHLILAGLVQYAHIHFAAEEALMAQHDYPEYSWHKQAHVDLVCQVEEICGQLKNGTRLQPINVLQFLIDWLTNHMMGEDKKYTVFFQSKGIV